MKKLLFLCLLAHLREFIVDLTLMCTMSKLNLVQSIILRLMLLLCTKLGLIIKSVTCTK